MDSGRRRRPPALAIAVTALALSLATPAYAAVQLARNSVDTRHLKDGAVTSAKVDNGTIAVRDLAPAARPKPPPVRTAADAGSSGALPKGTWQEVTTLDLPAGRWLVTGKGIMDAWDGGLTCDLVTGTFIHDRVTYWHGVAGVTAHGQAPLILTNVVALDGTTTVGIRCTDIGNGSASLQDTKITAVQVR